MEIIADLRNILLPARDQGNAPTCLAFAASTAHELRHKLNTYLSPLYLYKMIKNNPSSADLGLTVEEVMTCLKVHGQVLEDDYPYRLGTASLLPEKLATYKSNSSYTSENIDIEIEKLVKEQKYVPIVGLDLNLAFWQPTAEMNIIFDSSGNSRGLHAVLVVGIAKDNTYEKLFLIRNSWGSNWGNNGYAWITKEYLLERYRDSFYLQ